MDQSTLAILKTVYRTVLVLFKMHHPEIRTGWLHNSVIKGFEFNHLLAVVSSIAFVILSICAEVSGQKDDSTAKAQVYLAMGASTSDIGSGANVVDKASLLIHKVSRFFRLAVTVSRRGQIVKLLAIRTAYR
jgi:hypothetical protein